MSAGISIQSRLIDDMGSLFKAHKLVGTVVHLVRLEHEVVDRNLNATDEVVRRKLVPVPKLNGQLFGRADLIGRDEDERSLLPDRVEVLGDDTSRVKLRVTSASTLFILTTGRPRPEANEPAFRTCCRR